MTDRDYMKFSDVLENEHALVAAGSKGNYSACTVGWAGIGRLWNRYVMTVYLHPARYTTEFLENNGYFTVSFFPKEYGKALIYMGTHSGRDGEKAPAAGLTPAAAGESIGFAEAELTFVCRKLYGGSFDKAGLSDEIADYYRNNPKGFPPDENGEWHPHMMFEGEIVDVIDRR